MIVFERSPEFEDGLSLSLHLFRPASLKRGNDFLGSASNLPLNLIALFPSYFQPTQPGFDLSSAQIFSA